MIGVTPSGEGGPTETLGTKSWGATNRRRQCASGVAGPSIGFVAGCLLLLAGDIGAQTLRLPLRPGDAPGGRAFAEAVATLDRAAREERVVTEVLRGNVPDFLRSLVPVTLTNSVHGEVHRLTVRVAPDYLAVGSDADYLLMPLSPMAAERIADATGCQLPTRHLVDAIHAAARLKLVPRPIPPSPEMTSMPVFARHNEQVWEQRRAALAACPLGTLVAGHKKDVVATPKLATRPGRVAIYGWHQTNGVPIQPLYLGHADSWVDYSHGIRLVSQTALLDGVEKPLAQILADPELNILAGDEGAFPEIGAMDNAKGASGSESGWHPSPHFGEQVMDFTLEPGVRVQVNAPGGGALTERRRVHLVVYALPNGNTIEQTVGRRLRPGDDWHFHPERRILHTVQVERNGFIHSMLTGTPAAGEGYEYLGPRVYETFIQP